MAETLRMECYAQNAETSWSKYRHYAQNAEMLIYIYSAERQKRLNL